MSQTPDYKKKLIEVALPLDAINRESAREKSIRHGHPSTLHLWWARRPLAAARAVIWSSLVDDPSAHPDRFPTEDDRERERRRLFAILEELVKWENSNDEQVLAAAREEILRSTDGKPPSILDPFCGGGTIPLEAQRLGLTTLGGDLNPVAVLISKAMVEIPPRFAGLPPVNPDAYSSSGLKTWERAQGLAEDVLYYGHWMRERAWERIGHLYPTVTLPSDQGAGEASVIAWIWARTVQSPDPSWDGHVPLVRSWILSKRPGRAVAWVEPVVDHQTKTINYRVRKGGTPPGGTVAAGRAKCLATGTAIELAYVDTEAASGRLGRDLIAVVAEGDNGRSYQAGSDLEEVLADADQMRKALASEGKLPDEKGRGTFAGNAQGRYYGFFTFSDYFTDRQLVALSTFSDLIEEVRSVVELQAIEAGVQKDGPRLREGGSGAVAYADAVATYLAFAVDKMANYGSSLCAWHSSRDIIVSTFGRQAIPMVWDFAESNPFSASSGNFQSGVDQCARFLRRSMAQGKASIAQRDAAAMVVAESGSVVSTDPPYYDNISYADLSDFFYVWLRRNLRDVWPDELSTLLTPKAEELIASTYRHGSKKLAFEHFESGMETAFGEIAKHHDDRYPLTVFYAFKQSEAVAQGQISTGWETFLEGLLSAGLSIESTWPMRTEYTGNLKKNVAALASSIVLSCRARPTDARMATRAEFLSALRSELPDAVRLLQLENIAPVDLAQSAIGPGIAIFSRFSRVVEADSSPMRVRAALGLINEALQEVLSEEETEFDGDTRWALTWFEQHGLNPGLYGVAETLSKAKDTSVTGVVEAGIVLSRDGKVRLKEREELSLDWDPTEDRRPTVWEATQHLIRRLGESEISAADLLQRLGPGYGDRARQLAYLLYQISERKGWTKEAVAYNTLIVAWPELARLASSEQPPVQQAMDT